MDAERAVRVSTHFREARKVFVHSLKMKFGRNLPRNQVPEWASSYINYKALKKLIKNAAEVVKHGDAADTAGKPLYHSTLCYVTDMIQNSSILSIATSKTSTASTTRNMEI